MIPKTNYPFKLISEWIVSDHIFWPLAVCVNLWVDKLKGLYKNVLLENQMQTAISSIIVYPINLHLTLEEMVSIKYIDYVGNR